MANLGFPKNRVITILSNIKHLEDMSLREYDRPVISNYLNNKDITYNAYYARSPRMRAHPQGGAIWRGVMFLALSYPRNSVIS